MIACMTVMSVATMIALKANFLDFLYTVEIPLVPRRGTQHLLSIQFGNFSQDFIQDLNRKNNSGS
jgi:hypothetical protein